jgi:hypothetical protein
MANTFQSPVPGEPSLGESHYHYEELVSVDPASTADQTVTVANVPAGTKAIEGRMRVLSNTTAGRTLSIKDPTDGNVVDYVSNPTTAIYGRSHFKVRLNSSRQFIWSVDNTDVSLVGIVMTFYEI